MDLGDRNVKKGSQPITSLKSVKKGSFAAGGESLKLERIIGSTVLNSQSFKLHPSLTPSSGALPLMIGGNSSMNSEVMAYLAGTVVVVYNIKRNRQIKFLEHPTSNKAFNCIAFSRCGQYLAAGEKGAKPSIIVWDLHQVFASHNSNNMETAAATESSRLKMYSELKSKDKGHQNEIKNLCFSKDSKLVFSVGFENELKIWDISIPGGKAELKFSKPVDETNDILLSPNEEHGFITIGKGFVRFWTISRSVKLFSVQSVPANLDVWKQANFVSIGSRGKNDSAEIYTITSDGILCRIDPKSKELQSWVNIKVPKAFNISVSEKYVAISCAKGIVRLFETKTLQFKKTLPEPPPSTAHITLRSVFSSVNKSYIKPTSSETVAPNAIVCSLFGDKVSVMYDDRSFFVWDISNLQTICKYRSFISHSGSIWGADVLPRNSKSPFPQNTFATCSSDNTIRFWNLETGEQEENIRSSVAGKSAFCKDLLAVLHIHPNDKTVEGGVRSVRFSPDGCNIISGDKQGHVRVHDVFNFDSKYDEFAHESEVLCLDTFQTQNGDVLFGSGSRDRMIHLYRMRDDGKTEVVQTLDDHSSSVTSIKFTKSAPKGSGGAGVGGVAGDELSQLKLISVGADKSVVFRRVEDYPQKKSVRVVRYQQTPSPFSVFDLDVDVTGKWAVTAGQGKKINIYDVDSGKCKQYIETKDTKPVKTGCDNADPLKVKLCPAGIAAVTCSSDKHLRMYSFYKKVPIARVKGHSDVITSLNFTPDLKRLITTSADGCIFIWTIGSKLSKSMQDRLSEIEKTSISSAQQPQVQVDVLVQQPKETIVPIQLTKLEEEIKSSQQPIVVDFLPSPPPSSRGLASSDLVKSLSKQFDLGNSNMVEDQHPEQPPLSNPPAQWTKSSSSSLSPKSKNLIEDEKLQPLSKWGQVERDGFKLASNMLVESSSTLNYKRPNNPPNYLHNQDDDMVMSEEHLLNNEESTGSDHDDSLDLSDEDISDEEIIFDTPIENNADTSFQVAENEHIESGEVVDKAPHEEINDVKIGVLGIVGGVVVGHNVSESIEVGDLEAVSDDEDDSSSEEDEEVEYSKMVSKLLEEDLVKPLVIPSFMRASISASFRKSLEDTKVDQSAERFTLDSVVKKLRDDCESSSVKSDHDLLSPSTPKSSKDEINKKLNDFKEILSKHDDEAVAVVVDEQLIVVDNSDSDNDDEPEQDEEMLQIMNAATTCGEGDDTLPHSNPATTDDGPMKPVLQFNSPQLAITTPCDETVVEYGKTEESRLDQSDLVQIHTPRLDSVGKIKNNIAKLTSVFEETLQEMEKLSVSHSDTAMDVASSFQKMVAQMNVRMNQSTSISNSRSQFVFPSTATSGVGLDTSTTTTTNELKQVEVSDMLERYSSVLVDYIMKKVDKQINK